MTNIALLNNIEHKDLRVITEHRPGLGDELAWVPTFAAEFRALQAYYPIIFRKLDDGSSFEPIALLGFEEGENLFLEPNGWDVPTVPLLVERQPFLIGRSGDELMIQIDLDNPRVSKTEGEPVFLPHGGTSEYIDHVSTVLNTIHQGVQAGAGFIEALVKHELLEGFALDITLEDGSQNRLSGFYTIHEERLAALSADAVASLHATGHLAAIYYTLASTANFRSLIDRKNRRNAARR